MGRTMKRLAQFVVSLAFAILAMIVAESVTSEDGYAQQRHPDMDVESAPKSDPSLPRVARFVPPPEYARWWREIAICEGLPIPALIDQTRFYVVNSDHFITAIALPWWTLAVTYADDNEIFLSLPLARDERLGKHEMLHLLLHWAGYRFKNFHPIELFETCGLHRTGP